MNADDLIEQIGLRAFGIESPTEIDRKIYLDLLNTVHFELYRKTALVSPYVEESLRKVEVREEERFPLPSCFLDKMPFLIKRVIAKDRILKQTQLGKILEKDARLNKSGEPEYWGIFSKSLFIYPSYKGDVFIYAIEDAPLLKEETLEEEIPYPLMYHDVLVDGVVAKTLSTEGGLKNNKEAENAQIRWTKGYNELYQYYLALTGEKSTSTFSHI